MEKEMEVTPPNNIPHVLSESEGGWVAATKLAMQTVIPTPSLIRKSAFGLFQNGGGESNYFPSNSVTWLVRILGV